MVTGGWDLSQRPLEDPPPPTVLPDGAGLVLRDVALVAALGDQLR